MKPLTLISSFSDYDAFFKPRHGQCAMFKIRFLDMIRDRSKEGMRLLLENRRLYLTSGGPFPSLSLSLSLSLSHEHAREQESA